MERLTYFNDATGMYRLKPPIYTEDAVQVLAIYENLGTPKELRENKNFLEFLYNHIQPNEMEQYLAIYHASGEKGE